MEYITLKRVEKKDQVQTLRNKLYILAVYPCRGEIKRQLINFPMKPETVFIFKAGVALAVIGV